MKPSSQSERRSSSVARVASDAFRDRAAIVGVGYTEFSKNSGVSTLTLALRAITDAIADAGLEVSDIDGVATHRVGDSVQPALVSEALGSRDIHWYLDQYGGGTVSHSVVAQAALAITSGVAETVVCWRAINSRSEFRMGGTSRPPLAAIESQYYNPHGYFAAPQQFAMLGRLYLEAFGGDRTTLGNVAIAHRQHAAQNPRAMQRTPLTMDDYLAARWIAEPLCLFDCCLETDAAVAVVVTSAERARDLRQVPVHISGAVWGGGSTLFSNNRADLLTTAAADSSRRLFRNAGIAPSEVDVACLYDCFTPVVLLQLEDYGFCKKGEAGAFVADGQASLGGVLPVNPHGGFLSEGYVHGMNHIAEAVQQLRGDCGPRQVSGAEVALSTGQPGYMTGCTSALLLRRGA